MTRRLTIILRLADDTYMPELDRLAVTSLQIPFFSEVKGCRLVKGEGRAVGRMAVLPSYRDSAVSVGSWGSQDRLHSEWQNPAELPGRAAPMTAGGGSMLSDPMAAAGFESVERKVVPEHRRR